MYNHLSYSYCTIYCFSLTLFNIILGEFNFYEMQAAHATLGPIFFILYIFFVFFIMLNMFIAILNETYEEVKETAVNEMPTYTIVDFLKHVRTAFADSVM